MYIALWHDEDGELLKAECSSIFALSAIVETIKSEGYGDNLKVYKVSELDKDNIFA